jgi:hypothetical protein
VANKISIQLTGLDSLLHTLSGIPQTLVQEIDETVEMNVRRMANEAAKNAPVLTGKLAASIPPSVSKVADMSWEFGSDVEYATRQEYEHSTQKGFMRNAANSSVPQLEKEISEAIKRATKG